MQAEGAAVLPSTSDTEQFKRAVKTLVEVHQELKEHTKQGKALREQLASLKVVVIAFMENSALDVCNVSHNGKSGEIALRTSKRKKGLQKESAIQHIEQYLCSVSGIDDASHTAEAIWDGLQAARASFEVRDVSVRKL
eukprot:1883571-Pleurochrysis_carterae.AAC.2